MTRRRPLLPIGLLVGLLAAPAAAQDGGGVAAVAGEVRVERAGAAEPLAPGAVLASGEVVRTGPDGRARLVMADGSVVVLGGDAALAIVEQGIAGTLGPRTRLRLDRGAARAVVGGAAGPGRGLFEIETPTAVARVRGTEFVIAHDPVADASQVVGVVGSVGVFSVLDRAGRGVVVGAKEISTVERGRYPTPPQPLTETVFRQYLDQLAFGGDGRAAGLAAGEPLLAGQLVPEPDRASGLASPLRASILDFGVLAPADPWPPNRIEDQIPGFPGPFDQPVPVLEAGDLGVEF